MKLQSLLDESIEGIFGPYQCHIFVIEYQKHDVPHAHILVFLRNGPYFLTVTNIDQNP